MTTRIRTLLLAALGLALALAGATSLQGAAALKVRVQKTQAQAQAQTRTEAGVNPVILKYKRMTLQYLADAKAAAQDAKRYEEMIKAAAPGVVSETSAESSKELARIGVPVWGHATWEIEKMLTNTAPAKAAAAAAKAAAPFMKAAGEYQKAQTAYDATAQGYVLRIGMDQDAAKKLQTYANQYKLEGNTEMSNTYAGQAALLMKQAENYRDTAVEYHKMATRLHAVINSIQADAGKAGAYAAYPLNPGNSFGPEHVFPFTVAPPFP